MITTPTGLAKLGADLGDDFMKLLVAACSAELKEAEPRNLALLLNGGSAGVRVCARVCACVCVCVCVFVCVFVCVSVWCLHDTRIRQPWLMPTSHNSSGHLE
jgi:hypothetical protein